MDLVDAMHPAIAGSGFEGRVSQVNMWNRVLTPAELESLQLGGALVQSGLILDWDNYGPDAGCNIVTPITVNTVVTPVPSECLSYQESYEIMTITQYFISSGKSGPSLTCPETVIVPTSTERVGAAIWTAPTVDGTLTPAFLNGG